MSTVRLPEKQLTDAGVPAAWLSATLKTAKPMSAKRACKQYTAHFQRFKHGGIGLTLFGDERGSRVPSFYAVVKALIAQGVKVQVVPLDEITEAHFNEKDLFRTWQNVQVLAIPELNYPDASANRGMQAAVHGMLRARCTGKLPTLVGTSLEVVYPDRCVASLFPGVEELLTAHTLLVDFNGSDSEWAKEGHEPNRNLKSILHGM